MKKVFIVIHQQDEVYCTAFSTHDAAEAWIKTKIHPRAFYRIIEEEISCDDEAVDELRHLVKDASKYRFRAVVRAGQVWIECRWETELVDVVRLESFLTSAWEAF